MKYLLVLYGIVALILVLIVINYLSFREMRHMHLLFRTKEQTTPNPVSPTVQPKRDILNATHVTKAQKIPTCEEDQDDDEMEYNSTFMDNELEKELQELQELQTVSYPIELTGPFPEISAINLQQTSNDTASKIRVVDNFSDKSSVRSHKSFNSNRSSKKSDHSTQSKSSRQSLSLLSSDELKQMTKKK